MTRRAHQRVNGRVKLSTRYGPVDAHTGLAIGCRTTHDVERRALFEKRRVAMLFEIAWMRWLDEVLG